MFNVNALFKCVRVVLKSSLRCTAVIIPTPLSECLSLRLSERSSALLPISWGQEMIFCSSTSNQPEVKTTHTQTIFPFLSPLTAISSVFIGVWLIAGWLIPCLQSVLLHWLLSLWPLAHNMSSLLQPSCCSISHSASQCCCSLRQTLHTHCQLCLLQGLKWTFSLNSQFGY